jgi:hypothetical protein
MRIETRYTFALAALLWVGCGGGGRGGGMGSWIGDFASPGGDDAGSNAPGDFATSGGNGQAGCGELQNCYTLWAHSDHVLYHVDLVNKALVEVGPFNAPMVGGKEDGMTDLAVASDGTIYTISHTNLYTADPKDGHVTLVSSVQACGTYAVALTFTPDGTLYAGDYKGAFCKIDPSKKPATVTQIAATLGNGLALAGDIVAIADGTMFGTAQLVSDGSSGPTAINNILVKMNPATGQATQIGPTGYPKMFGVAFDNGQVFGFTHDGSGDVVTINPKTGAGTKYATFNDPATGKGIAFAGAGVNTMVPPPPVM